MLKHLVNIAFGQFDSQALNSFVELVHLDLLIVVLIKEQKRFGEALEFLLNFNCDKCHNLR